MLAIKLSRTGKKNFPYFRIVIVDKMKDPWGRVLENVGNYNPRTKEIKLDAERIKFHLGNGAQATNTVYNLLVSQGLITGTKKRSSRISKKRKTKLAEKTKSETAEAEKKAEAAKAEKAAATPVAEEKPVETVAPVVEKPVEATPAVEEKPAEEVPPQA